MIETSGADDQVVKILCPLIITDANLKKGLDILAAAIRDICAKESEMPEESDYFDNVQLVEPELTALAS